jgi:hypothetical protein
MQIKDTPWRKIWNLERLDQSRPAAAFRAAKFGSIVPTTATSTAQGSGKGERFNMFYTPITADQSLDGLDNAQLPPSRASLVAADCSIYPFFQQSTPLSDHIQTALRLL